MKRRIVTILAAAAILLTIAAPIVQAGARW